MGTNRKKGQEKIRPGNLFKRDARGYSVYLEAPISWEGPNIAEGCLRKCSVKVAEETFSKQVN